jgi:anti-sigma factor RsiW
MDCKVAYSLIQDYLDGVLGGHDALEVERHIAACGRCSAELEEFRTVRALLDEMEKEEVPRGFGDVIISRLRAAGKIFDTEPSRRSVWHRVMGGLPPRVRVSIAASAVFLVCLVGVIAGAGVIKGAVGKGTVMVTNTYLDIEDTLGSVGVVARLFEPLERQVRMLKTFLSAVVSLLTAAGETYMLPILGLMTILMLAVAWYVGSLQRRSSHNASHIF